jgi:hypothetical protein
MFREPLRMRPQKIWWNRMRRTTLLELTVALLVTTSFACSDEQDGADSCPEGQTREDGECAPERQRRDTGQTGDSSDDAGNLADANGDDAGGNDATEDLATGGCRESAVRCSSAGVPQSCISGVFVDGESCLEGFICLSGRCIEGTLCEAGEVNGCASDTEQLVCNDDENGFFSRVCDPGPYCFRGECGSQLCEPRSGRCGDDDLSLFECSEDGEEWVEQEPCDDEDGEVCSQGECVRGCAAAIKDTTYIGCEYWSVDLPQYEDPFGDPRVIPHAVVFANTGDHTAEITVEAISGVTIPTSFIEVLPGEVGSISFPRLDVEDTRRTNFSFRISTTEPVVAYQFNPLNDVGVASNDASLLLPTNAIGCEYYVVSRVSGIAFGGLSAQTGWFTVVGVSSETTTITITFTSDLIDGPDAELNGITAGSSRTFDLEQYDVLNFEAQSAMFAAGDLTGTHIRSSRPIVVFSGHEESAIGEDDDGESPCCADHLEEQLFPVSTWGTRYLAVHSPPRGTEDDVWRVISSEDGALITTTPAVSGLNGITLDAGDWVEVSTPQSFEIVSTRPILAVQFLVSQEARGVSPTIGDPAMILSVPVEQFRDSYALLTPTGYAEDYVTVVRPVGVEVILDGGSIAEGLFTAFGALEYEYAWIELASGPHALSSDQPFAVSMYGYDRAVSYGYPGGLDLDRTSLNCE